MLSLVELFGYAYVRIETLSSSRLKVLIGLPSISFCGYQGRKLGRELVGFWTSE